MEKLKIGEKVLMFETSYKENGKIDLFKTLVENSYEEVIVKKYNDDVSNIVTVIDEKGEEYSGTYFLDNEKEKICFLRKQEFINGLRSQNEPFNLNQVIDGVKLILEKHKK